MKLYQGEALTFTMEVESEEDETMDMYVPRAVLVFEAGYNRDCASRCDCKGLVVMRWDNIPVTDGIAAFEMTTEQSASLEAGTYLIEVALHNKSDEKDIKGQVSRLIEILPSYTIENEATE